MKDEQFITAMHQAVAERGTDYRFDISKPGYLDSNGSPLYQTPEGEGACLIGYALLLVDKSACPAHYVVCSAEAVLPMLGISRKVSIAARVAQIAQDNRKTWGEALFLFNWTIQNFDHSWWNGSDAWPHATFALLGYNSGQIKQKIDAMQVSIEAVKNQFKALAEALDAPEPITQWASGGIVTGYTKAVPSVCSGSGKIITFVGDPAPAEFVSAFDTSKVTYSFA